VDTLWDSGDGYSQISAELRSRFRIHHVTLQVEKDLDCDNGDCCG